MANCRLAQRPWSSWERSACGGASSAWPRTSPACPAPSSSWLNLVEHRFRELTDKRLRRGSFASVPVLIAAIRDDLDHPNPKPQIFVWSASVERILATIATCQEAYDPLHSRVPSKARA